MAWLDRAAVGSQRVFNSLLHGFTQPRLDD